MGPSKQEKTPFEQGKTPPNKGNTSKQEKNTSKQEKPQQTRETPFKQGKHLSSKENAFRARNRLSSKGYLPIRCKSLRVVGVSRQGKAVVSDGGYGVRGDAEGAKGKRGRRRRGVGPAGRPSLFPFGGSIILKSDIDMTREESRPVFGGSIVNELLSLGAEPTNAVRQDGLIEWKSAGCIEVGGVHVWAYYYFEDGEDVDRCDWEDHMEIEIEGCWI